MKTASCCLFTFFILLVHGSAAAEGPGDLSLRRDTRIVESPETETFCPATAFRKCDDGSFENGYVWGYGACVPPDYGAWAERFTANYVCGVQFVLTQVGSFENQTMDVYLWEYDAEGNPPPGPDPGNVLCVIPGVCPDSIALYPEFSTYNVLVCCEAGGEHFAGFWGDWPDDLEKIWFIAADEDGAGPGDPRTKIAPGLPYPTGWSHPNAVPTFENCKSLGIREYAGPGNCLTSSAPDPDVDAPGARRWSTWGAIKALY